MSENTSVLFAKIKTLCTIATAVMVGRTKNVHGIEALYGASQNVCAFCVLYGDITVCAGRMSGIFQMVILIGCVTKIQNNYYNFTLQLIYKSFNYN